ncbi:MAG: hypothetical protein HY985_12635 [Magnetospirillum sp.]|nr:hypothetical protein [Magnetospirillum sp.]
MVVFVLLLVAPPAYAYVDPGSGTLLLQIIGAVALGSMFYIRTAWLKLRGFFDRFSGKSAAGEAPKDGSESK